MMWADKGISQSTKDIVSEEFDLTDVAKLHSKLILADWTTRSQIPGLVEMRVETIHLASYLVQWVLEKCALERLLLSTYALKEGVLHRVMEDRL
jgi:exopolyphosphatase/pppGpp-phosphohydrolase